MTSIQMRVSDRAIKKSFKTIAQTMNAIMISLRFFILIASRQLRRLREEKVFDKGLEISVFARSGHEAVVAEAGHIVKNQWRGVSEFNVELPSVDDVTDRFKRVGVDRNHFDDGRLIWLLIL